MNGLTLLCLSYSALAGAQYSGNALQFDGQDDFASIADEAALVFAANDTATIELWLNPAAAVWHAMGKRAVCTDINMNYQFAQSVGNLLHFNTTGCLFPSGTTIPDKQWSHIAVTADGNDFRFYIDGELVNQATCTFGADAPSILKIGNSDDCNNPFSGTIDEVRIWNTARSDVEMDLAWDCTMETVPPGLIAYWKFDEEMASQVVVDSSGSGFDGSLGANLTPGDDDPVRVVSTAPLICELINDGFEALK